jgi:type VII secretion-associated serine protease mycosin
MLSITRARVRVGLAVSLCSLAVAAIGPAATARADAVRDAQQPVLRALAVPAAWRLSTGRGITVAVLDTGVDGGIADLAGSVTTGPDYTVGADPHGYRPPRLHGTYIASLIAGHGSGPGRGSGVVGVAPDAHILAVRVLLDDSEPGFTSFSENARYADTLAEGIRYAVSHGADVINMSLGGPAASHDAVAAIGFAISRGIVVVAAAGNDGTGRRRFTPFSYPAAVTGVISVAALTLAGQHASFSDHNASVVVGAPGAGVVGAGPGGGYLQGDGTSQASAFVAGVAALIRAKYPRLQPALVTRAIIQSTTHRPHGGYSTYTGFGEVNAAAAVRAAARLAPGKPEPGLSPLSVVGGRSASAPIKIVYRHNALIAAASAAAVTACLGLVAAIAVLILTVVRRRRQRPAAAGVKSPAQAGPPLPP